MFATQASPGKSPMVSARFSRVKLDLISPITTALPVRTMQIRTPIWRRIYNFWEFQYNNPCRDYMKPLRRSTWGQRNHVQSQLCLDVRRRNMHWSLCRRGLPTWPWLSRILFAVCVTCIPVLPRHHSACSTICHMELCEGTPWAAWCVSCR